MAGKIIRVTMFKIPVVENQHKLSELYKTLSATAEKVNLLHCLFPYLPMKETIPKRFTRSPISYKVNFIRKQGGKPYILSLEAGPLFEDARSQGFTFAAKSEFASKGDMAYYDTDCQAHGTLKVCLLHNNPFTNQDVQRMLLFSDFLGEQTVTDSETYYRPVRRT
jgi:hypothetical protein